VRVISVQPHFRAGGAEMQTLLLSNELVRRGVETHLVLHSAEGELLGELDPAVRLHDLGLESHAALPLISARLSRKLAQFDGGLVIVKLWASLLAALPASKGRSPLLFAMCEDADPTDQWRRVKFGRLKRSIVRRIFRTSDLVTANTDSVAHGMVATYSLDRTPDVVYGGVDVDRIRELAGGRKPHGTSPLRVVTVASLRGRKGHARILAGLSELEEPWLWDVVGDGPEAGSFRDSIPPALRDRVRFHGATANPYPLMAAADVLVHLPYSEAFGIVVLESLALGVPVVASPCIGPLEIGARLDPVGRHLHFADPVAAAEVAASVTRAVRSGEAIPPDLVDSFNLTATADRWLRLAAAHGVA
jgi:glycosyltransferase involved in cell wall biosynthesis